MKKIFFITFFVLLTHNNLYAEPYSLKELITMGLSSHPSISAKESGKNAAEDELFASKLQFLPTPSVNTQRNKVTYENQSTTNNLPSTTVTINQPLFLDGSIINGYKKAQANLRASHYNTQEAKDEVALRIINAYSEWLRNYKKIEIYKSNVIMHEKFIKMVTSRFDNGLATGNDKDLVNSRLSQTKAELISIEAAEKNAINSLNQLINGTLNKTELSPVYKIKKVDNREGLILKILEYNPTILRLKSEAEAAELMAKQTLSQSFPQLSIQAQRQIGNPYTPGWPSYNSIGINLAYAPGSGFANIALANASFNKAKANTFLAESARRELVEKINTEINEYELSNLRRQNLQESSNYQIKINESFERQFQVNKKNWLDLLNSLREKIQVETSLVDSEIGIFSTSNRLYIYTYGAEAENNQ